MYASPTSPFAVVSGELEHKDSMGNVEVMKRGDLQMTSAGTGITHAEVNPSKSKAVHFLQVRSRRTRLAFFPPWQPVPDVR